MVLSKQRSVLELKDMPTPEPLEGQVLVQVHACGVCRTDLHVVDGELQNPKLPLILGHEIVGKVVKPGKNVTGLAVGDRVGIPWLGSSCGTCEFCCAGKENLCNSAGFTGYNIDGGYAEYVTADHRFCFKLDLDLPDVNVAPLLCAGLIGFRSFRKAGNSQKIGIFGFGAAAHIITQIARFEGREIFAFTRPGDAAAQRFARELGACWAGDSTDRAPVELDAAIIFAPVGGLIPQALKCLKKGGTLVCGGIYMSEIPSFSYELLWGERVICSVANLTRQDGLDFFEKARKVKLQTSVQVFPMSSANEALEKLRHGQIHGAAVLVP
jgi:propanol-preferring alcohol dehydrogenase